jgi:hypothetical protein
MRAMTFAFIGVVAIGIFPAAAASEHTIVKVAAPGSFEWEQCHIQALRWGRSHGRHSTHKYMSNCVGKAKRLALGNVSQG